MIGAGRYGLVENVHVKRLLHCLVARQNNANTINDRLEDILLHHATKRMITTLIFASSSMSASELTVQRMPAWTEESVRKLF